MASPNLYQTGIGGTTGPTLTTSAPIYLSGDIWYVSSTSTAASDAGTPRGKERIRPLATLAQAVTNAAAGDRIVCLQSHAETLTSTQTISKAGLTIVGEGSIDDSTAPQFTRNIAGNGQLFDITAASVRLENLMFPATITTASTGAMVRTAAAGTQVLGCWFETATFDDGPCFETVTGASACQIKDTTFLSTAAAPSSQPESAIKITNAITDLELDTVSIDGGTSGWSNPYAFNGAGAITRLRMLQVSLLDDSDITLATGTTGWIQLGDTSGSARVVWAS